MSVAVGYVLTLAIGAAVLSGVVIGVGGVVDSQTDRAVHGELAVVGETTVANLESADRLARAAAVDRPDDAAPSNVSIAVDLPSQVAGRPYRIAVTNETVTLRTDDPDVRVAIPHAANVTEGSRSVRGGPLRIAYEGDAVDDPALEVTER
ncbi:hypothetical protein U4E84_11955 [Halorubrum sp. AD140]|uniref:DUF7266 family protein n=1 Tax=Halorubrum sp. AD140 TaxID=3050073 RepID=UPI002ACC99FB|nr:hypothetical protein [Halorubrum sp. AD140]MDZ5812056.1 hypothetical protein [Halorubrum sp. AD140]